MKQVMPKYTDGEKKALREMIELTGVVVPCYKANGEIIDGLHRKEVCAKMGKKTPVIDLGEMSEEKADVIRFALNMCRRHLPMQMKGIYYQKMIAAIEKYRNAEASKALEAAAHGGRVVTRQENDKDSGVLKFSTSTETPVQEVARLTNSTPKQVHNAVAAANRLASLPEETREKMESGELPMSAAVKDAKSKPDAFKVLELAVGKSIRLADDLNRSHPNKHHHADYMAQAERLLKVVKSWRADK